MSKPVPLQFGSYYHIYNRGNNRQNLFLEERNFSYFLEKYWLHIPPVADTYAFCLLWNHFHLLVRVKTEEEQRDQWAKALNKPKRAVQIKAPSQQFGNLFNSYAKAVNKVYERSGCLFEHPFHRISVESESYFIQLVLYIHRNPERHGFVSDFRDWPFSSYHTIRSQRKTALRCDDVIDWFDSVERFEHAHAIAFDEPAEFFDE